MRAGSNRAVVLGLLLAVAAATGAAQHGTVLLLDMTVHENGTIDWQQVERINGSVREPSQTGRYAVRLLDAANETLTRTAFAARFGEVPGVNGSGYRLTQQDVFMRLPFDGEAAWVTVEQDGTVLAATSLADRYCPADGQCTAYCDRVGGASCGHDLPWTAVAVAAVVAAVTVVALRRR